MKKVSWSLYKFIIKRNTFIKISLSLILSVKYAPWFAIPPDKTIQSGLKVLQIFKFELEVFKYFSLSIRDCSHHHWFI